MPISECKNNDHVAVVTTVTTKLDEFIFCFNRHRFLLPNIQLNNFSGWTLFMLLLAVVLHIKNEHGWLGLTSKTLNKKLPWKFYNTF